MNLNSGSYGSVNEPARCDTGFYGTSPRIHSRELPDRPLARNYRRALDLVDRARRVLRRAAVQRLPAHLGIPKAVLAERLALLVAEGVLTKTTRTAPRRVRPYRKGAPAVADHLVADHLGQRELPGDSDPTHVRHVGCGGTIQPDGICTGATDNPRRRTSLSIHHAGPVTGCARDDPVSRVLRRPHRLLEPIKSIPT